MIFVNSRPPPLGAERLAAFTAFYSTRLFLRSLQTSQEVLFPKPSIGPVLSVLLLPGSSSPQSGTENNRFYSHFVVSVTAVFTVENQGCLSGTVVSPSFYFSVSVTLIKDEDESQWVRKSPRESAGIRQKRLEIPQS